MHLRFQNNLWSCIFHINLRNLKTKKINHEIAIMFNRSILLPLSNWHCSFKDMGRLINNKYQEGEMKCTWQTIPRYRTTGGTITARKIRQKYHCEGKQPENENESNRLKSVEKLVVMNKRFRYVCLLWWRKQFFHWLKVMETFGKLMCISQKWIFSARGVFFTP